MYCKWCGMDSKDEKRCEWCGRPFAASTDDKATTQIQPQQAPPQPAPTRRAGMRSLDEIGEKPSAFAGAEPTTTITPPTAPVYTETYAPTRTAPPPRFEVEVPQIDPFGVRFEKFLGVMLLPLAIGMFVAHQFPEQWYWALFALLFPAGLSLGLFRVINYYDNDEAAETWILLAVSAVIGPVYGTLALCLVFLVKRGVCASLVGLMLTYFVLRFALGSASQGIFDTVGSMIAFLPQIDIISRTVQLFPLALLFGGWFMSSFWRPLNEN